MESKFMHWKFSMFFSMFVYLLVFNQIYWLHIAVFKQGPTKVKKIQQKVELIVFVFFVSICLKSSYQMESNYNML